MSSKILKNPARWVEQALARWCTPERPDHPPGSAGDQQLRLDIPGREDLRQALKESVNPSFPPQDSMTQIDIKATLEPLRVYKRVISSRRRQHHVAAERMAKAIAKTIAKTGVTTATVHIAVFGLRKAIEEATEHEHKLRSQRQVASWLMT